MVTERIDFPVNEPNFHHWLVALLMCFCSLIAWWLTPHEQWFEHLGKPQFEEIIPKNFADWTQVPDANSSLVVNPQQQEALNDLYNKGVVDA